MTIQIFKATVLLILLSGFTVNADTLKVFVKKDSQLKSLSANELRRIYLGKVVKLPSGVQLTPLDHDENSDDFSTFYNKVVRKTPSQANAYWSRQIFSGKGRPPNQFADLTTLTEQVQKEGDFVAYTTEELAADAFKVLFELEI